MTLGVVLVASIISITVVAVVTDRGLGRADLLILIGVVLLASIGGISWAFLRHRRRWRLHLEQNGDTPTE